MREVNSKNNFFEATLSGIQELLFLGLVDHMGYLEPNHWQPVQAKCPRVVLLLKTGIKFFELKKSKASVFGFYIYFRMSKQEINGWSGDFIEICLLICTSSSFKIRSPQNYIDYKQLLATHFFLPHSVHRNYFCRVGARDQNQSGQSGCQQDKHYLMHYFSSHIFICF